MPDLLSPQFALGRRYRSLPAASTHDRASLLGKPNLPSKNAASLGINPMARSQSCDMRDDDGLAMVKSAMLRENTVAEAEARAASKDNNRVEIAQLFAESKELPKSTAAHNKKMDEEAVDRSPSTLETKIFGALENVTTPTKKKAGLKNEAFHGFSEHKVQSCSTTHEAKHKANDDFPLHNIGEKEVDDKEFGGLDHFPTELKLDVSSMSRKMDSVPNHNDSSDTRSSSSKVTHHLLNQEALMKNAPMEVRNEFYNTLSQVSVLTRAESQMAELELKKIQLENKRLRAESPLVRVIDCITTTVCQDNDGGSLLRTRSTDCDAKEASKKSDGGIVFLHRALNEFTAYVATGYDFVEERLQQLHNNEMTSLFGKMTLAMTNKESVHESTLATAKQEDGEWTFVAIAKKVSDEAGDKIPGVEGLKKTPTGKDDGGRELAQVETKLALQTTPIDKAKGTITSVQVATIMGEEDCCQCSIIAAMIKKVEIAMVELGRAEANVVQVKAKKKEAECSLEEVKLSAANMEEDDSACANKKKMPFLQSKSSFTSMKSKGSFATEVWEEVKRMEATLAEADMEQAKAEMEAAQADEEVARAQDELQLALREMEQVRAEIEAARADVEVVAAKNMLRRVIKKRWGSIPTTQKLPT